MQKWPQRNWNYVTENADTFLAQSLSQDDPYLLYCALNSGLNTIIVTKDLMRSHLFKLVDPRLKVLFNHWLMQSQYQLKYVDNRGRVFFKVCFAKITLKFYKNHCFIVSSSLHKNSTETSRFLAYSFY